MKKLVLIFAMLIIVSGNAFSQEVVKYSPERVELIKAAIPLLKKAGVAPTKQNVMVTILRAQRLAFNTIGTTNTVTALDVLKMESGEQVYLDFQLANR